MRDVIAAAAAVVLVFVAASLATTLQGYRRRRQRARETELALGRALIAELPIADDLVIVSQDQTHVYYGDRSVEKDLIVAVRVLINGSPIAGYVSRRHATDTPLQPSSFEDRPEGIARDRWDVAVETRRGMTLIECGAVRERVSQELARTIYDVIKADVEGRDATTPSRERPRHD
jgi:hypothetical protein